MESKIKAGMKEEYVKRHNEIWEELKTLLKEAGICNYTIWTDGNTLFGYYECEKGVAFAAKNASGKPRRRTLERIYERRNGNGA